MGCDIHSVIETCSGRFNGAKGIWSVDVVSPINLRWYALFEVLAGVRGEVKNAIAPPRGYPPDSTNCMRAISNLDGGTILSTHNHSASYLTLGEIRRALPSIEDKGVAEYLDNFTKHFLADLSLFDYDKSGDGIRLVFDFDN